MKRIKKIWGVTRFLRITVVLLTIFFVGAYCASNLNAQFCQHFKAINEAALQTD